MENLKYFYQYMLAFPEKSSCFARDWAKGLATLKENAAPGQIVEELGAILKEKSERQANAENLAKFYAGDDTATEFVSAARELYNNICAELDDLFIELCQALRDEGLTITGGEISALKRAGVSEALTKALDAIKRKYRNSIPEAERLNAEDAEALYNGLIRAGFIKGSLTDFVALVGKLPVPGRQSQNKPVSWLNSGSLFAFFAWQFTKYTQSDPYGFAIRQKALCEAFGIEERQRQSTIAKDMADFKNGHRNKCKGSAEIERIFAALPGNNKPTNNNP